MRVLLWMVGADIIPGGHRVQLDQTAAHLQKLGVDARVSFEAAPKLHPFDIVHGFAMTPETLRRCRNSGVAVAISPIYWSRTYTTGQHDTGNRPAMLKKRLRLGLILLRGAVQGQGSEKCDAINARVTEQRLVLEMADLLLPNSQSEAKAIQTELGVSTPCHVAPNSVDPACFTPGESAASRDYLLYSGRFEPHKNQLGLIRALKGEKWPVKLVGKPHPHHPRYFEACQAEAPPHIEIIPGVPHEDLVPLYRGARLHVLPSWFETTGLVSLEAALCGCNLVTTSRGYARDYFGEMAWYCDPAQPQSIRDAIAKAWDAPVLPELRAHILDNFTWEHTARASLEGYEMILAQRRELSGSKP